MNAIKSMYGRGHADATRTRECVAMPGVREQSIYTPQCIIDVVLALWPGQPIFDPCWHPDSIVPAPHGYVAVGPGQFAVFTTNTAGERVHGPAGDIGGLRPGAGWVPFTYCNPPYGRLRDWLECEGQRECNELVMLVPHRTHRKWYRHWKRTMDVIVELDPVKFHGYAQAFPAPLALGYRGVSAVRFATLASHLGDAS